MSGSLAPTERHVTVNGEPCRVWEKGSGEPLVFLGGLGGTPRWSPFLERLCATRHVIVPSMPGHPGSRGHDVLDSHLDWLVAMNELVSLACERIADATAVDLAGVSVGAALAADLAALWPTPHQRLILVAPLGAHDQSEPITDFWAQTPVTLPSLLCHEPARFLDHVSTAPDDPDAAEWQIENVRASTAEARLLWPMCDTGLVRRLHRVTQRTLLVWGNDDKVIATSYAQRFSDAISGPVETAFLDDAGHLVDLDAPEALASRIESFLARE